MWFFIILIFVYDNYSVAFIIFYTTYMHFFLPKRFKWAFIVTFVLCFYFFSRTTWAIFTNLSIKHSYEKENFFKGKIMEIIKTNAVKIGCILTNLPNNYCTGKAIFTTKLVKNKIVKTVITWSQGLNNLEYTLSEDAWKVILQIVALLFLRKCFKRLPFILEVQSPSLHCIEKRLKTSFEEINAKYSINKHPHVFIFWYEGHRDLRWFL